MRNKRWLVAFCVFFAIEVLFGILLVSLFDSGEEYSVGINILLNVALWAPLTYIFGYKERGTKLLFWTALSGIVSISKIFTSCVESFKNGETTALIVQMLIISTCAWFLIECFLLREENKKIKQMKKLCPTLEETCAS